MTENEHILTHLSKYHHNEAKFLEKELNDDAKKDGPMVQIVNAETQILTNSQIDTALALFNQTKEPQILGVREFSFQGHTYILEMSIAEEDKDTAVRVSIKSPQGGTLSSHSLNVDLELRESEVAFRQYNFFDSNGTAYLAGSIASADTAPKGFAKSLVLSTSLVVRLLMKALEVPKVEASIGDASQTHQGDVGWTQEMARRLGFTQSSDFSDLFFYTYE